MMISADKRSTVTSTTHALIRKAQCGDAASFEEIYRIYRNLVYSLCLRMTKRSPDAEDLTQEVFLQARRKLYTFRGDSSFGTWLYKVAFNRTMMFLRRHRIEESLPEPTKLNNRSTELIVAARSHGGEPLRTLALKQAIASLPEARRSVVILHDINGFSHREVGLQLGIAVRTSKARLQKAHVALRVFLGNTVCSGECRSADKYGGAER